MLQSLHVKNLALIDEIEVEFAEGLNILTGETGAGKSIILGSVNLALGGRYTKDLIRQGENYALVELVFTVTEKSRLKALEKLCIYPEDGLLILSRKLMDGRSVSRINGETVTIAVLKEVAAILIDIHGQHEHQSLLYKKNHLGFVDAFAWDYLADIKKQAASAYQEYRTCKKTLDEADMDESSRAKELDFLKFEVSEIEDAMLKEGEDEELETTFKRMENGRKIAESTAASYAYTDTFRQDITGSDKSYPFRYEGNGNQLFVFEAPIDLLSFICLYPQDWQTRNYLALGGVSGKALDRFLSERKDTRKVFLCLDSDTAGNEACTRLAQSIPGEIAVIRLVPARKDWNDVLRQQADIPNRKFIAETITLRELPTAQPVPMLRMADVELTSVDWLWFPYIPFGKLTIIQGNPGDIVNIG